MKIIACIASGPSLSPEDCLLLPEHVVQTIAINSSWQIAPWGDVIFASDIEWWRKYHAKIDCGSRLWISHIVTARQFMIRYFNSPLKGTFNSGQHVILLASAMGADRILLLGYDCSLKNGEHWHGQDPFGLGNPTAKS
ncbi:MAG: hypothetical protein QM578_08975 [Pantoea sp.]|uniref:hypothetical protein n=1 Tax=Pantoea sp. TaxID=69393 RepID=UPI0039E43CF8